MIWWPCSQRPGAAKTISEQPDSHAERAGVWFALTAYGLWGVIPVYFKFVDFAGPFEIIAHRICWAVLVLAALIVLRRQMAGIRHLNRQRLLWLVVSGWSASGHGRLTRPRLL